MKEMLFPNSPSAIDVPKGTPNGTLFVCVGQTWGKQIKSKMTGQCVSLEDCARGYWKQMSITQSHANDCDYLMAHYAGEIRGVWKINRKKGWRIATQMPKKTWPEDVSIRPDGYACELIPVDAEISKKFVGKTIHLGRTFSPLRGYFTVVK